MLCDVSSEDAKRAYGQHQHPPRRLRNGADAAVCHAWVERLSSSPADISYVSSRDGTVPGPVTPPPFLRDCCNWTDHHSSVARTRGTRLWSPFCATVVSLWPLTHACQGKKHTRAGPTDRHDLRCCIFILLQVHPSLTSTSTSACHHGVGQHHPPQQPGARVVQTRRAELTGPPRYRTARTV